MKLILYCTVLFAMFMSCSSLNILGIFPYQGKSHFLVFRVYLQELARRGHNVTVISHFPEDGSRPNYHDISLAGSEERIDQMHINNVLPKHLVLLGTLYFLQTIGVSNCRTMLKNKGVQELLASKPQFDVIVLELFNTDCALGLAYKFNAPTVAIVSHVLMPWHYERFGIPHNPAFVPFHFLEGGTKPSLFQRVESTIVDFIFNMVYKYYTIRTDQNTLAEYFDDIPPLQDLAKDIKLALVYQNFVLTGSRLLPANVIEVGGFHVGEPKNLTGDLLQFVEQAKHGIIYISFGTTVKTMSGNVMETMLRTLDRLPQKVIWKWDKKEDFSNRKNIYVSNWLPQNDILAHPNTKVFFSHAGLGSTTEAIHYGVPMIATALFGDQPSNAAAIAESGLGVQVDIRDITEELLLEALQTVLNPNFHQNVKKLSTAWRDRPISPLDSAVYWTEFAARYSNMTFRAPSADVPMYQYFCLDVILVLLVIVLVNILFITFVCKRCRSSTKTEKSRQPPRQKTKKH